MSKDIIRNKDGTPSETQSANKAGIKRYGKDGPEVIPSRVWIVALPINLIVPGLKTYAYKDGTRGWYVIEARSGESVGFGKTRKAACDDAIRKITYHADKVKMLIERAVKIHGAVNP